MGKEREMEHFTNTYLVRIQQPGSMMLLKMMRTSFMSVGLIKKIGTMKRLVLQAWLAVEEIDFAKVFTDSYLEKDHFNCWYYCALGILGHIPQNNIHERSNLDTKRCACFRGIIQQG
jgi:hypothetical protein